MGGQLRASGLPGLRAATEAPRPCGSFILEVPVQRVRHQMPPGARAGTAGQFSSRQSPREGDRVQGSIWCDGA